MSDLSSGPIECAVLFQFQRYLDGSVGLPALQIIFALLFLAHMVLGVRYARLCSILPGTVCVFLILSMIAHGINIGAHTDGAVAPIVLPNYAEAIVFIASLAIATIAALKGKPRFTLMMVGAFTVLMTVYFAFVIASVTSPKIRDETGRSAYPPYLRFAFGLVAIFVGGIGASFLRARYVWIPAAAIGCNVAVASLAYTLGQFPGCFAIWQLQSCENDSISSDDDIRAAKAVAACLLVFLFFIGFACQAVWIVVIRSRLLRGLDINGDDVGLMKPRGVGGIPPSGASPFRDIIPGESPFRQPPMNHEPLP